jgi:hypothetical protein
MSFYWNHYTQPSESPIHKYPIGFTWGGKEVTYIIQAQAPDGTYTVTMHSNNYRLSTKFPNVLESTIDQLLNGKHRMKKVSLPEDLFIL